MSTAQSEINKEVDDSFHNRHFGCNHIRIVSEKHLKQDIHFLNVLSVLIDSLSPTFMEKQTAYKK